MTAVLDAALSKQITERAEKAAALVVMMSHSWADESLTKADVEQCAGLAFFDAWRAGLGISVGKGSGFLIRKLQDSWSAPVFFDVTQGGVGLGFGFQTVEAVVVMSSMDGMIKLCEGKTHKFGAELITMTAGQGTVSNMTYGQVEKVPVNHVREDRAFAKSEGGILLNIGVTGTELEPDHDLNLKLYGAAKMEDVLAGAVPIMPELAPLYQKLDSMIKGTK